MSKRGKIGTACQTINLGFPQGEIRSMLRKALAKKITESEREFLLEVRKQKKLSQLDRQQIFRIYRNH